ncbi:MAG: TetR/AcrR family transcriptional regulator [Leptospiraceae bacterium]|nr:TetR/AcrR family transcriptional regulator [Leptospiraceae bacterium]
MKKNTEIRKSKNLTRNHLLFTAYREIYKNGSAGASLNDILQSANISKGAIYYYFDSKRELVLAIIREIIHRNFSKRWRRILETEKEITKAIIKSLKTIKMDFKLGCPLNKLIQEADMNDAQISQALNETYFEWEDLFTNALDRAKKNGELNSNIRAKDLSAFIVSVIEGSLIRSKLTGNKNDFLLPINQLEKYLYSLKTLQ